MARTILLLLIFLTPTVQTPQANANEAGQLWEKVLTAKGGRDRLHKIDNILRSFRIPSKLKSRAFERQVEELFVFPDRYWRWSDERPTVYGISAVSLNFKTGLGFPMWETDPEPRISVADRAVEGYRLDDLAAIELLETRWLKLEPKRTWTEKKGRVTSLFLECKFQMTPGWATVTFTLDEKTLLPKHARLLRPLAQFDDIAQEDFDLLDYTETDGIQMPSLIRRFGALDYDEKIKYRLNVDYDPLIFERGPSVKAGPEGWQKR